MNKHIVYFKAVPGFLSLLLLDDYLCYEENEKTEQIFPFTKYEIFKKSLPLANAGILFERSHVCIIIKKKQVK